MSYRGILTSIALLLIVIGTLNGATSVNSGYGCNDAYLDLRKPVHYVVFPHTIGYYLGRIIAHPYGEKKHYETQCDNIFNHTLKGPRER